MTGERPARHHHFVGGWCYEQGMTNQCRECRDGLEHCHGTVIVHARFGAECTESDCDRPELAHTYRIDCDAIGCACAVTGAATAVVTAVAS